MRNEGQDCIPPYRRSQLSPDILFLSLPLTHILIMYQVQQLRLFHIKNACQGIDLFESKLLHIIQKPIESREVGAEVFGNGTAGDRVKNIRQGFEQPVVDQNFDSFISFVLSLRHLSKEQDKN